MDNTTKSTYWAVRTNGGISLLILFFFMGWGAQLQAQTGEIKTSKGLITFELYPDKAPRTVANFLRYVKEKKYDGGSFFRATTPENEANREYKIEVIQGGIADVKNAFAPIVLESTQQTGLKHLDGTLSMARAGVDTARDNFFICINAQPELNYGGKRQPDGMGFAAFGRVTNGMDIVRLIQQGAKQNQRIDPVVVIESIRIIQPSASGK